VRASYCWHCLIGYARDPRKKKRRCFRRITTTIAQSLVATGATIAAVTPLRLFQQPSWFSILKRSREPSKRKPGSAESWYWTRLTQS